MPQLTEPTDMPPVVLIDRRRTPERRTTWRGGRRDGDWINRPPGTLTRMDSDRAGWRWPWLSARVKH